MAKSTILVLIAIALIATAAAAAAPPRSAPPQLRRELAAATRGVLAAAASASASPSASPSASASFSAAAERAAMLPRATAAREAAAVAVLRNCSKCADNSTCCGGEQCCNGGGFCCPGNSQCCSDTCCDSYSESCCPDKENGGVCCMRENTFCCPANPSVDLPSRCCPRWFVCCNSGKYGCCDPGSGRPLEDFEGAMLNASASGPSSKPAKQSTAGAAAAGTAWALLEIPTWEGDVPMYGLKFDLASPSKDEMPAVHGFNDWGEIARVFTWNAKAKVFYLPQANFLGPGKDQDRPINVYTVNPETGVATKSPDVTGGPKGLVTGYAWDATAQTLVMGTRTYDSQDRPTGYAFWTVDPSTGKATHLTSQSNTPADDTFAGWFRAVAHVAYGETEKVLVAYRNGFKDVVASQVPGVGVTILSGKDAGKSTWIDVTGPTGYSRFYQTTLAAANGTQFFGVAAASGIEQALSAFIFEIDLHTMSASSPRLLAALGNAHLTPKFGPIGIAASSDFNTLTALVVHDSIDSNYDTWALSVVNRRTRTCTTTDLTLLAQTDSVSGLGVAA